jgi:hypothetical protein
MNIVTVDTPTKRGMRSAGLLFAVDAPNTAAPEAGGDVVTPGGGVGEGGRVGAEKDAPPTERIEV